MPERTYHTVVKDTVFLGVLPHFEDPELGLQSEILQAIIDMFHQRRRRLELDLHSESRDLTISRTELLCCSADVGTPGLDPVPSLEALEMTVDSSGTPSFIMIATLVSAGVKSLNNLEAFKNDRRLFIDTKKGNLRKQYQLSSLCGLGSDSAYASTFVSALDVVWKHMHQRLTTIISCVSDLPSIEGKSWMVVWKQMHQTPVVSLNFGDHLSKEVELTQKRQIRLQKAWYRWYLARDFYLHSCSYHVFEERLFNQIPQEHLSVDLMEENDVMIVVAVRDDCVEIDQLTTALVDERICKGSNQLEELTLLSDDLGSCMVESDYKILYNFRFSKIILRLSWKNSSSHVLRVLSQQDTM
ncbi:hypothetical protein Tco_0052769 [Tanacetum coccineum]